jgi:hypothetical protein
MHEDMQHHLEMAEKVGSLSAQVESLSRSFTTHAAESHMRQEAILTAISALKEVQLEDPDLHRMHHQALQEFIDREKKRSAFLDRIKSDAGKSVLFAIFGAVLYVLWEGVKAWANGQGIPK